MKAHERVRRFLGEELWTEASWPSQILQLGVLVAQGFVRDRLTLRATALAYVSALSLIPFLALAGSIIGALGVSQRWMEAAVARLAVGRPEAAERILELVQGVNLGSLGSLGATVLFATTVLALGNAERALNDIWGVRRQRTWMRRFADYLTVMVVAPLLLGVALSVRGSLESQWLVARILEVPEIAQLYQLGLRQLPTLLTFLAFSFFYWFLPNTEVRPLSALLGGLLAALLFDTTAVVWFKFNVGAARFGAIYGGLAVVPLVLVWIYVSWLIVLLGAELAFAHQNLVRYRRELRVERAGSADREAVGLALALATADAFARGEARSPEALAESLQVSVRLVRELLEPLESAGILAPRAVEEREEEVQLARPAEAVRVADVCAALRGSASIQLGAGAVGRLARDVTRALERQMAETEGQASLADLLERLPLRHPEGAPGHSS